MFLYYIINKSNFNLKLNFKGHLILTDPNLVINGRSVNLYLNIFRVLYKLYFMI